MKHAFPDTLSSSMRTYLLLLFVIGSRLAIGQTPAPASAGFQSLLTGYYEDYLTLNPTRASYLGDYRYNDQLENTFSQPYRDQMKRLAALFRECYGQTPTEFMANRP